MLSIDAIRKVTDPDALTEMLTNAQSDLENSERMVDELKMEAAEFDGQLLDTYTDRFHSGWMFYFPDTREVREATERMTIWATEHGVELKVLSAMKARTLVFKISNPGVPANVAAFLVFKLCTDKTLTWRHRNPNFDPHTLFMEAS